MTSAYHLHNNKRISRKARVDLFLFQLLFGRKTKNVFPFFCSKKLIGWKLNVCIAQFRRISSTAKVAVTSWSPRDRTRRCVAAPPAIHFPSSPGVVKTEDPFRITVCLKTFNLSMNDETQKKFKNVIQFHSNELALTVEGSVLHLTRIPRQNIGAYLCIGNL